MSREIKDDSSALCALRTWLTEAPNGRFRYVSHTMLTTGTSVCLCESPDDVITDDPEPTDRRQWSSAFCPSFAEAAASALRLAGGW